VKVRQSASLVAGVCTLCVAASGTVTPLPTASAAAAPAEAKTPVVSRPYLLDAATTPIDQLASFPYQSLILVLKAAAGVAGGADGLGNLGPQSLQGLPAIVYQAITQPTATSNLETLPAAFQTAINTEVTALQNLTTLPERILALLPALTALSVAQTVLTANTAAPALGTAAAVTPAAATISPIDQLASFPYQAGILILKAAAGVAGGADGLGNLGPQSLQGLPAIIYQAITQPTATSNLETLGAAFQTAIGTEETALQNLTTLPARILALLPALSTLNVAQNAVTATPQLRTAAAVTPAAATISPIDQLASFPYQAGILVLKAAAGVAGGADGLGNLGPQSLQGLPAIVYQAITQPTTASNLETLPAAFQTAIGTEETALQNLTTLPARIAALLPSATTLNAAANNVNAKSTLVSDVKTEDAVTPSTTKPSLTPGPLGLDSAPAVKKAPRALTAPLRVGNLLDPDTDKDVAKGAGKDATTDVDKSSTTPATTHTKKPNDNPVSNAIKSITKAAKDSGYTGKHRADAKSDGAKDSGSKDGGKK
jgi:hypothetical protein